jgi:hypothetical protein
MSILRYLNKHHGWYDGKRTPFTGAEEAAAVPVVLEVIEGGAAAEGVAAGATAAEAGYTGAAAAEAGTAGASAYGAEAASPYMVENLYTFGAPEAGTQAAQESARQAAIQNAGNSQLTNAATQYGSQYATGPTGFSEAELNAISQGQADALASGPSPYEPTASTGQAPLVEKAPTELTTNPATIHDYSTPLSSAQNQAIQQAAANQVGPGISSFMPSANQLMVGGGLYALNSMMNADRNRYGVPAAQPYTGPLNKMRYDPNTYQYNTPVNRQYTPNYSGYAGARYAKGGIADIDQNQDYAKGGIAGLLKGRGDGMSDSIQATIADKQPARLADGEFVVPADVVSHLGNGSTDAGAKHLYKMMDKVRHARTGTKKQGKQIKAGGYLPIK